MEYNTLSDSFELLFLILELTLFVYILQELVIIKLVVFQLKIKKKMKVSKSGKCL